MKPDSGFSLTWPPSPAQADLTDDQVQVWSAKLTTPPPGALEQLSPDERQRAGRYLRELDRDRFVARRCFLRAVLARCLALEPSQVSFVYDERGKPHLAGAQGAPPLHFSLSSSAQIALVAVTRSGPVGVDVECVGSNPDMDSVAGNFFSANEIVQLAGTATALKPAKFLELWTRKEAYFKATGEGLIMGDSKLECAQPPPEWRLVSLSPAPGYCAALALAAHAPPPLLWRWSAA